MLSLDENVCLFNRDLLTKVYHASCQFRNTPFICHSKTETK